MRFSLFTLVLLSLWFGTGMLVWQRREPWVKTHVLKHSADVRSMHFFPDNRRLLVCTREFGCVWDIESGRELGRIPGQFIAAISPDGGRIATWGADAQEVRLWDGANYTLLRTLQNIEGYANDGAFSPDGKSFLLATRGGEVRRWAMDAVEPPEVYYSLVRIKNQISYSPDGKSFLAYGDIDDVFVFSIKSGRVQFELPGHADRAHAALFSPDGKYIVSGGSFQTLRIWQSSDGKILHTMKNFACLPLLIVIAPDSTWFVCDALNEPSVWNLKTGEHIARLKGHRANVNFIGIDPASRRIGTVSSDSTLCLWDARTGQQLLSFSFPDGWENHGAQSSDGLNLAASSDKDVWLWRNRHPEWWWGHFYRVEVWVLAGLTVAMGMRMATTWRARRA